MGIFEMGDLAGNDVGWRLRQGFNLVGMSSSCNTVKGFSFA